MPDDESWDDEFARRLVGRTMLVGITLLNPSGEQHTQCHGRVTMVERNRGVFMRLEGTRDGEEYSLPPDLSAITPAQPGSYRLRLTGEVVEDPDYLATWTIHPRAEPDG